MAMDNDGAGGATPYQMRSFDEDGGGPEGRLPARSPDEHFDPNPLELEGGVGSSFEQDHAPREGEQGETDFASIKFQRENTLLTNAERYAESIRNEAELYVKQMQSEIQALDEQAQHRYGEASQIKEKAEAEAAHMIVQAEAQVEEIRKQANEEGLEQGREEGMQKRYEEAASNLTQLERIMENFSQFRRQVNYYMENDGVRLALLMARKVLNQELLTNKKVVLNLLASTLAQLEGQGQFRIWLSPQDLEFATAARPSLEKFLKVDQSISIGAKPDLEPGNALIETDREVIDLTITNQFQLLENRINQTLAARESEVLRPPAQPPVRRPATSPDRGPTGTAPQQGRSPATPSTGETAQAPRRAQRTANAPPEPAPATPADATAPRTPAQAAPSSQKGEDDG